MRKFLVLAAVSAVVFYASCSSINYNETIKGPEEKFYQGNYLEAARELLPAINKKSNSQLLFMMEAGYMLHAGGNFADSNKALLPAGKLAKIIPTSITQHAGALLTNNSTLNYKGEDFEKVLVHMYLGINFMMLGKYESAGVEFKLVNEELEKIRNEQDGSARYKQNIMAKYLTASAYEMIGEKEKDMDDLEYAYKELEQIYALNPRLSLVHEDLVRLSKRLGYDDDVAKWSAISRRHGGQSYANSGEFLVIFQSGLSAIKRSRGKLLDDATMKASINVALNGISLEGGVTIAAILAVLANAENPIPYFDARSDQISFLQLRVGNQTFRTTMLEDISSTAVQNLKDDYNSLKLQVAAGIVTKAAASILAGIIAKELAEQLGAKKGLGSLLGTLAGAGTGIALFSQIGPDLRSWHTLPAKLHVGRIMLPPGKHHVTIQYIGPAGILTTKTMEIEIKKGEKTIFNTRTLI